MHLLCFFLGFDGFSEVARYLRGYFSYFYLAYLKKNSMHARFTSQTPPSGKNVAEQKMIQSHGSARHNNSSETDKASKQRLPVLFWIKAYFYTLSGPPALVSELVMVERASRWVLTTKALAELGSLLQSNFSKYDAAKAKNMSKYTSRRKYRTGRASAGFGLSWCPCSHSFH